MRFAFDSICVIVAVFACCFAVAAAANEWKLVWSDEFDHTPDAKRYDYEIGFLRNDEQQYYTAREQNLYAENGTLHIVGLHEMYRYTNPDGSFGIAQYTSASIMPKMNFTYGKFEMRARVPHGNGSWPAFWLLNSLCNKIGWPRCGEIDVMENVGYTPNISYATLHFEDHSSMRWNQLGNKTLVANMTTNFSNYTLIWTPLNITMMVNGETLLFYARKPNCQFASWPFSDPYRIKLNLAIGGGWGGQKGIDKSAFPMEYEIDYVRVWQRDEVTYQCQTYEYTLVLRSNDVNVMKGLMTRPLDQLNISDAIQGAIATLVGAPKDSVTVLTFKADTSNLMFIPFLLVNMPPTRQLSDVFARAPGLQDMWFKNASIAFTAHTNRSAFVDAVRLTCENCPVRAPFSGIPSIIPGKPIVMANYDYGGPGVAFYDDTDWNTGADWQGVANFYRAGIDWVDMAPPGPNSTASPFVVTANREHEWRKYAVLVLGARALTYNLRAACVANCNRVHLEVDGVVTVPSFALKMTKSSSNFTANTGAMNMTGGPHTLTVCIDSDGDAILDTLEFKTAI